MTRTLTLILSATLAAACAGKNEDRVVYATSSNTTSPVLVAISPEVEVVADAKAPVFRANNAYWLYRGDRWYRSSDLNSGTWMQIGTPPRALASIGDPHQYVGIRPDTRTAQERELSTQRTERMQRDPEQREPLSPVPNAPYPRPPQQQPPVPFDDPGTTDQVPHAPRMPPDRGDPVPAQPDDLGRPDPMRD
jgi:hypothetical protein